MDCSDIEDALLAGEELTGEAMAAHVAGCETCRFLVSDGAGVARALAGGRRGAAVEVAGLEAAVFGGLRAERGWRAWLRERSRGARLAVIAAVAALEALLLFVVARRVDWEVYPVPRMALAVAGLAGATLLLGWLALRPVWMRPLPRPLEIAAALVALGVPLLLALLPELPTPPPFDEARSAFAARCLAIGAALGTVVFLVARLVDRGGAARWPAVAAAMAGGLSGALALQLECPVNHPWHLVAGHGLPVVVLAVVGWLARRR